MIKLKPCPFCGGEAKIQIRDDEGNFRNEDYRLDPWSGLTFSIKHYESKNKDCPIASHDDEGIGTFLYQSEKELERAWNNRSHRTTANVRFGAKLLTQIAKRLRTFANVVRHKIIRRLYD